jgi:reverse gyrase
MSLSFIIFDENKDLSNKQKKLRMKLVEFDMRKILEYAISDLNE